MTNKKTTKKTTRNKTIKAKEVKVNANQQRKISLEEYNRAHGYTNNLSTQQKKKKSHIFWFIIIAIFIFYAIGSSEDNTHDSQGDSPESEMTEEEKAAEEEARRHYKWKKIDDGETCPNNADLCYIIDDAHGYTNYGYGTVSGRVINNTGKDASYMQISFSIYNASGAKTGDCWDNVSGLTAGKTWVFEAYCTSWNSGGSYGDLNISWW